MSVIGHWENVAGLSELLMLEEELLAEVTLGDRMYWFLLRGDVPVEFSFVSFLSLVSKLSQLLFKL